MSLSTITWHIKGGSGVIFRRARAPERDAERDAIGIYYEDTSKMDPSPPNSANRRDGERSKKPVKTKNNLSGSGMAAL